jgi:hypothetical protein
MAEAEAQSERTSSREPARPSGGGGLITGEPGAVVNPLLALHRVAGNQAVQRQIQTGRLPMGLILGQPGTLGNQAIQRLLRDTGLQAQPTITATEEQDEPEAEAEVAQATAALPPPVSVEQPDRQAEGDPQPTQAAEEAPPVQAEASGGQATTGGVAGAPIQRLMSYKEFMKLTQQSYTINFWDSKKKLAKKEARYQSRWGSVTFETMNEELDKQGLNRIKHEGINKAFETYEAEKTLANLIKLQDSITYWQTFNFRALQNPKSNEAKLNVALNKVLAEVRKDVAAQTSELGDVPARPATAAPGPKPGAVAGPMGMPGFLFEVGVALGYYKDNLAGNPGAVFVLELLYERLNEGNLKEAQKAIGMLETMKLPGFSLIRSLFLAHFADKAQLGDVVGTQAKSGELTPEEKEALENYTRSSSAPNAALRAVDLTADTTSAALKYRPLVSALSKLPTYTGVAYRGQSPFSGIDDVWRPGAVIADLAFTSSSSSLQGVEYYLYGGGALTTGSKSYYSVIRAKTAVYIADKSTIRSEAEVLFKPGTRFRIKAVWQHIKGRVPRSAPHEVKSVLLRVGDLKTEGGFDKKAWDEKRRVHMLLSPDGEDLGPFEDQIISPVKVFEMDEI